MADRYAGQVAIVRIRTRSEEPDRLENVPPGGVVSLGWNDSVEILGWSSLEPDGAKVADATDDPWAKVPGPAETMVRESAFIRPDYWPATEKSLREIEAYRRTVEHAEVCTCPTKPWCVPHANAGRYGAICADHEHVEPAAEASFTWSQTGKIKLDPDIAAIVRQAVDEAFAAAKQPQLTYLPPEPEPPIPWRERITATILLLILLGIVATCFLVAAWVVEALAR